LRGYDHIPVLLDEVLHNLVVNSDALFVDATIGGGGHGYHLLETSASIPTSLKPRMLKR